MSDLRQQLQGIYESNGQLTPTLVVDTARDENHPLHGRFEWDDAVAGEKYREEQARELIRSVRIVYREATETEGPRTIRAFHSLPTEEGREYRPIEEIATDDVASQLLRNQMKRAIDELVRRFSGFDDFWQILRDAEKESAA